MSHSTRNFARSTQTGFSLVEVLVALVVCSIGLLGLAKMESLALSSEDVSGARAVAAMQASSLAAMMHADRGYWGSSSATASAVITGGGATYNVSDTSLTFGGNYCTTSGATSCTPILVAAKDLYGWASGVPVPAGTPAPLPPGLLALLPGYQATITCTPTATNAPVTCTIALSWVENAVTANSQQSFTLLNPATTYTLSVEP